METEDAVASWENKRQQMWNKISVLTPETFQKNIWSNVKRLIE
jgi:hypothetical protein